MNSNFSGSSDDPLRVERGYGGEIPASIAIVQAIGVIENVDPMDSPRDLGITLYEHVDPEALDRLVDGTDAPADLTVELALSNDYRYAVEIRDSGRLVVERAGRT